MAAGGFKEFVAGETLDQDEINDFLMQGVLVFAGTAARGSAITAPVEGQFAFLKDSDALTFYDGTQWAELSTTPGAAVVSATTGSPTLGTVSSGGTTYNVYSFTGSGSITIDEAGFAELLIIGGGGGGGSGWAGGGGAGGFLSVASAYLPAGTATVTVGAGGAGQGLGVNAGISGLSGFPSRIGDFISPQGGGSGAFTIPFGVGLLYATSGQNGASGGGSSGFTAGSAKGGGSGVSGLGNAGGSTSFTDTGGGGGGAGAVGANATSSSVAGNGGNGSASSITGSSVTYAGGGGGSASTGTAGSGGTGGGGSGAVGGSNGTNGSANTGGGGGGASAATTDTGGNGGSGIVIVRVAV